jgi:hypothetical protein
VIIMTLKTADYRRDIEASKLVLCLAYFSSSACSPEPHRPPPHESLFRISIPAQAFLSRFALNFYYLILRSLRVFILSFKIRLTIAFGEIYTRDCGLIRSTYGPTRALLPSLSRLVYILIAAQSSRRRSEN